MEPEPKPLYKIADVARRLAISPQTIRALVKSGALKAFKIKGSYRWDDKQIESYLFGCETTKPARPSRDRPRLYEPDAAAYKWLEK